MILPILNKFIDSRLNDNVFNRTKAEGLEGFFNFIYSVLYFDCVEGWNLNYGLRFSPFDCSSNVILQAVF